MFDDNDNAEDLIDTVLNMPDTYKRRQILRRIALDPDLMNKIAAHFEQHQAGWGKLYRTDKQKLIEEINKKIAWASDPNRQSLTTDRHRIE